MCKSLLNFLNRKLLKENFSEDELKEKAKFGNLLKIKDNYPKVVVSGEKMFENTYEGIEHIYIRDFLSSVLLHSITRVI